VAGVSDRDILVHGVRYVQRQFLREALRYRGRLPGEHDGCYRGVRSGEVE